ncbi:terminase small subunit [Desulfosediminicola ganghwensis]|uniref:terminase small subunit n=1 Tax=Desulfosediminicola ganghwensis TaxID=2569540 RepID=UPI0010AB5B17|nr:terminase small subunit [Desulfosediminicola ganghwensis]
MTRPKFTPKQQMFLDFYCGNATEAARRAGYAHPTQQGNRLLTNVNIRAAITERESREHRERILNRQERQELWTRIALGLEPDLKMVEGKLKEMPVAMRHRLKALECLAKSEGDFMTKLELDIGLQEELAQLSMEEIRERIKRLEDDGVLELIAEPDGSFSHDGDDE